MATNWQPPFGLPLPPFPHHQPTPQQQSQPQPDTQNGPSEAHQPPPAGSFATPPAWNIPGLNFQAHSQNAQQPQFPAAWPPNFPTPEQLAQWNQMQVDMQQLPFMMLQNPPSLPGLGLASNLPPQSPFQSATPTHPFSALPPNTFPTPPTHPDHVVQTVQHPNFILNDRVVDITESDKEEGELSDGGRTSQSPIVNGRIYPDPPRSAPLNPPRSSNNSPALRQKIHNLDHAASQSTSDNAETISKQRNDAKTFIKLLHNNNIGYHTLAAEALDASSLRDLYRSLNLPSEPEPVPSPPNADGNIQTGLSNGDNVATHMSPSTIDSKPPTAVNTTVPPAKSAPSPANRKEYLAQLQAAKKARQQGGAKDTPPRKTPSSASTAKTASATPNTGPGDNGQQLTEAEKKAKTTELIRRRIEALKKNSSSPAGAASPKPPSTSLTTVIPSSPLSRSANSLPPTPNVSAPQSMNSSPFGSIPGLFMNPPLNTSSSQLPVTPGSSKRKRSIPSNVDNLALQKDKIDNVNAAKVNDKRAAVALPATQATPTQQLHSHGTQAVPMLPGFPSRSTSANQSASGLSTPGPQTPSSSTRSQEMDEKEKKQAALKERLQKKIEEQKRQAEQNRLASAHNSPKPLPQQTPLAPQNSGGTGMSREPKRRRKVDIEAEQSVLDSEIAENAAKLAQITREFEILTANDKKMRLDKERLQAELESLGIDTEGMPHAELQAKRDEIDRAQSAAFQTLMPTNTTATATTASGTKHSNAAGLPAAFEPGSAVTAQHLPQPLVASKSVPQTGIPGLNASLPPAIKSPDTTDAPHMGNQRTPVSNNSQVPSTPLKEHIPAKAPAISSEHDPGLQDLSKPTTPFDDEEDFYSPEPANVPLPANHIDTATSSLPPAQSPSEEGEMAMSESEEEEYEPEEALEPTINSLNRAADPQVSSMTSPAASSPADVEEDSYEPPDVGEPITDLEAGSSTTLSKPLDQPLEPEEEEMDMSTSSDSDSDSEVSSESSEDESNVPVSASGVKNLDSSVIVADDLAPELQTEASAVASTTQNAAGSSTVQEVDTEVVEVNPKSFIPYESPLKLFKSYRYHPDFAQNVTSGFLSMTFSHQIDEEKPLCEHEASGNECVDANCPDQHFRDMNITGEKLLVQLGTANPGRTPEERQRWNDGLRSVLKDLRQKNSKDPNGIAMEIANYRRQFLQDDTRVVNL